MSVGGNHRSPQLGVGVVGLGTWGEAHIRAWRDLPGMKVVAICSSSPNRAREVAARYGIPHSYSDIDDLAEDRDVDIVSVVNDERLHLRTVLRIIQARKPMLVEKPIAPTVDDARLMVDAAIDADVLMMPGHVLRFDPSFATVKDQIESGELGDVVVVHSRRLIPVDRYARYQRSHPSVNVTIHDVDLALWYMGADVERITAFERNVQGGDVPDVLHAVIEFRGGGLALVSTLWLVPPGAGVFLDSLTEVTGSKGMAFVRQPGDSTQVWRTSDRLSPDLTLAPAAGGLMTGALRDELAYFASCVLEGRQPTRVTGEDAVLALDVANRIREAAGDSRSESASIDADGTGRTSRTPE